MSWPLISTCGKQILADAMSCITIQLKQIGNKWVNTVRILVHRAEFSVYDKQSTSFITSYQTKLLLRSTYAYNNISFHAMNNGNSVLFIKIILALSDKN